MKKYPVILGTLALAGLLCSSFVSPDLATTKPAVTLAATTTLPVNTQNSSLKWNAQKVGGEHYGTVQLAGGNLQLNGKKISGGEFTIDMTSITVEDITREDSNKRLTGHLKSDDFFSVEKHPEAKFVITKATPLKDKSGNNYTITGNLTIKGITNAITFPANITINGKSAEATAKIEVDRTKYDIKYRSGLVGTAADKVIYDNFTIDLKLVAGAAS